VLIDGYANHLVLGYYYRQIPFDVFVNLINFCEIPNAFVNLILFICVLFFVVVFL